MAAQELTHEEINEAMERFLAKGGQIQRIEYQDNGFVLSNELGLDEDYSTENLGSSMLKSLGVDYDLDPAL